MRIWRLCEGENQTHKIEVAPWRVVEAQHISSSRDLVDTREEHDLLEELLEEVKPPIANQKHYLIFTPFRYPPLKYGSRFGRDYEKSLWYGSIELETAFAEVAYYRLKFFDDTSAALEYIEIPVTAFKAFIKTSKGIDLTSAPFNAYKDKISNKEDYKFSQTLGTDMRDAGIDAFLFDSARTKEFGKNIAAYTPDVFIKKNNQYIANMQNWRCLANKNLVEFIRYDFLNKERWLFS